MNAPFDPRGLRDLDPPDAYERVIKNRAVLRSIADPQMAECVSNLRVDTETSMLRMEQAFGELERLAEARAS